MSRRVGTVTVHCPICGWPMDVPVMMLGIGQVWQEGGRDARTTHIRVDFVHSDGSHVCGPPPGDGKQPVERFVKEGHLDDPTLR